MTWNIVPDWDWPAFEKRRNGNGLAKMTIGKHINIYLISFVAFIKS
jgi:hypothetical protein